MTSERDGADSAMEEAARLQIELDALHAKAHRIQLRHEAAEAKLAKIRSYFLNERYPDPERSYAALTVTGVYDDILAILDGDAELHKRQWWRCLHCGTTAPSPLTDETSCECADYYDQEWVRVPLPSSVDAEAR